MSITKRVGIFVAAGAAVLGAAAPAYAAVVAVGGGTWDYGSNGTKAWSKYHHPSVCHGSSVQGEELVRSLDMPAGQWAMAWTYDRLWRTEKSYWRHC